MEDAPRREILALSWGVEVLVRQDDHEWWLSGAQRFATEQDAIDWGTAQLQKPMVVRYQIVPSLLPPSPPGLFQE